MDFEARLDCYFNPRVNKENRIMISSRTQTKQFN